MNMVLYCISEVRHFASLEVICFHPICCVVFVTLYFLSCRDTRHRGRRLTIVQMLQYIE